MKRILTRFSWLLIGLITIGLLFEVIGIRINTSNSIPKGVYWISTAKKLTGQYVIFCPKNTEIFREARHRGFINKGFCPDGFGYLMKKVAALENDRVSSTALGVFVNGQLLPFSQPKDVNLAQWRVANYRLKSNELLLMTDQSAWSFDGRYFGLTDKTQIKAIIKPLLTWPLSS
ncbi:conjugative transfer signal peptidase TraF [Legionella sp.]|uniref:conjugative transfer signal peptidase TraF n=1 Tax=Legionella sp. TaxID=459 RepID=UPI000CCB8DE5|nr:conjugative transfer signal peptidase TraF [Legionella sp.]PJE09589.1 MAG: conjugative transfer signal peptidase TraF [Legionella sp.]